MSDLIVALITTSTREEAENIAMHLINSNASPCINIISPCLSVYQWKGEVRKDEEVLMIVKSRKDQFSDIREIVERVHSYDVPEIISLAMDDVSPKYRAYIEGFSK